MKEKGIIRVEETKQIITFKLGEEEFGVDILQVKEIEKLDQEITRVPKAPGFVEGVFNLRGDIVPIVDLRKRFGLSLKPLGRDTRVIIAEINDNSVGMMVDSVTEVLRIPVSSIEDAPNITKGVDTYYLNGVAKINDRLIVLLNLERSLSTDETKELKEFSVSVE